MGGASSNNDRKLVEIDKANEDKLWSAEKRRTQKTIDSMGAIEIGTTGVCVKQ